MARRAGEVSGILRGISVLGGRSAGSTEMACGFAGSYRGYVSG